MNKIAWLILLVPVFMGCASARVSSVVMENPLPATVSPELVETYRSLSPQWPYREIGRVSVHGKADLDSIYRLFRKEAARLGAHGVVNFEIKSGWNYAKEIKEMNYGGTKLRFSKGYSIHKDVSDSNRNLWEKEYVTR